MRTLMPIEYTPLLKKFGFDEKHDFYDTVTGFDYDVMGVLFDEDSPFDLDSSESLRQPENLECLLRCSLKVKPHHSTDDAVTYFMHVWFQWLRQQSPLFENIERTPWGEGSRIRIVTISTGSACTFDFKIAH